MEGFSIEFPTIYLNEPEAWTTRDLVAIFGENDPGEEIHATLQKFQVGSPQWYRSNRTINTAT